MENPFDKDTLWKDFDKLISEMDIIIDNASAKEDSDLEIVVAILYSRIYGLVSAIRILLNNSYSLEADHLARCCLETLFYMGAIINDEESLKAYLEKEIFNSKEAARFSLKHIDHFKLSKNQEKAIRINLKEQVDKIRQENLSKLTPVKAAQKSGLLSLYSKYCMQSDGIHSSPHFLRRNYTKGQDNVERIDIGPCDKEEQEVLTIVNCVLVIASRHYRQLFAITTDDIFGAIHSKYLD